MSRPAHIDAQREDIYLEFLEDGMTEEEAKIAMEKRMEQLKERINNADQD